MPFQPSSSAVHVDAITTQFMVQFLQDQRAFVADRVFPVVNVSKQSDKYFVFDRSFFYRNEARKVAPGTAAPSVNYDIATGQYVCDPIKVRYDVADEVRANADNPLNVDRDAVNLLTQKILIRKEVDFATNFLATSKWGTDLTGVAANPNATQFLQWNLDNSTPIEAITAGCTSVQKKTGFRPNKLVLGREVFDVLKNHPDIIGRIDRGQTSGAAIASEDGLARLFGIENVYVMDSVKTTSDEGAATNTYDFIGGKSALLCYAPSAPSLQVPSAGYNIMWTGYTNLNGASGVRRFREEALSADVYQAEMAYDQKLISADLGYFFASAVA